MIDLNSISIEPPKPRDPRWSKYQNTIFDFVEKDNRSASIEAVAGSGKTTTIIESMKYLPVSNACFLAFNKSIADELKLRVPPGVAASTFHSLGNSALLSHRKMKLNKSNVRAYLENHFSDKYKKLFYNARQLIDISRNVGLGLPGLPDNSIENLAILADDFDIAPRDPSETDVMLGIARSTLLSIYQNNPKEYDFTDMLYLPLLWDIPLRRYPIVFTDESQDLNHIQHLLVERAIAQDGRLIAVGDTHQAIYGFRGAAAESMYLLGKRFNSVSLPLSISYRCPRTVIELEKTLVPHIESAPSAIDGDVFHMNGLPDLACLGIDDMVICRNNLPIISTALKMLALRLPMRVLGDFGDKLISFIGSFKTTDINILRSRMSDWVFAERERLTREERWGKLEALEDKYSAITAVMTSCRTYDDITTVLSQIFEQGNGPILSTIHKAKGLEARRVFLLYPELLPSPYARSVAAIQQEKNLLYVAYTRAKEKLYLVHKETDDVDEP